MNVKLTFIAEKCSNASPPPQSVKGADREGFWSHLTIWQTVVMMHTGSFPPDCWTRISLVIKALEDEVDEVVSYKL